MDYDVVIVGAGPAGSCAARFLAEGGAKVALVDAARFPRPKPCAGWINERALGEFPFLDAVRRKVKAAPFKCLVFHSPDLKQTARFANRSHVGYIVTREKFDAELVAVARAAGVKTFLGKKVVGVDSGEASVAAILADGARVTGRILVGADGVRSTVARAAGLRPHWGEEALVLTLSKTIPLTPRQRATCFGDTSSIHVALGFGGAPGYAWAFPGAAQCNVGIGVRTCDAARLRKLYDAWVAGLRDRGLVPATAKLDAPDAAAVPAGAAIDFENHVGKRVVLIGDAGGFASSASSEGIYPAIRSAAIAVRSILRAIDCDRASRKGAPCQDELQAFKVQWRQQLASYIQMPNVNAAFLLPLIYSNQEIADRFGRAFLFGENL